MNKHMQRRLQQQLKTEQHPLNQEALEILKTLHLVSHYPDKAHLVDAEELNLAHPDLPILDLLRWAESPYLLYDLESPSMNPVLYQLEVMLIEGEDPNRVMQLITGPHGENGPVGNWTDLGSVPHKQEEAIKQELRWSLKLMIKEVQHEMNLRQQRHDRLMDWFHTLSAARQDERKAPLSALTPEQEKILLDWMDIVIVDTIADSHRKIPLITLTKNYLTHSQQYNTP